ncbi:LysR family transcriptional regulator [Sphingobium aromaticiconvertens]|uniref:LysR family transcriptional regulator n=1 Tax=Sphingobium aromaticiconvertens TaxID=365341 RepID=UPI0030173864
MNLQHLRYLAAFAEHRTLTDAAESLGISQPAISRALHELQEELHCELFQRAGRRLEMTSAGHEVLKAARRALAAVDDIHRIPGEHGATDILRIATLGAMAAGMASALEQFLRRQPDTRVQVLHVSRDDEMIDMLRRRDADVAYGSLARPPRGLTLTPARPLEIVLASPIGTRLPPTVTLKSLHQLPMLCPPLSEERRRLLDEPCERAGATPKIVMESSDSTTYLSGIQAGIGSSAMWDVNAMQATGIEVRRFDPPREIAVGFVHPTKPTANVRTLLGISRKLERELRKEG